MKRRDATGDAFGPGTDLVISLFAIMTCLFAFAATRNAEATSELTSMEDLLSATRREGENRDDQLAKAREERESLEKQVIDRDRRLMEEQKRLEALEAKNRELLAKSNDQQATAAALRETQAELQKLQASKLARQLDLRRRDARFRQMVADEQRLRQEVLELKGDLDRVVFVVDASRSMSDSQRWQQAQSLMANWLKYLPVKEAALVVFNDSYRRFPREGGFLPMNDKNRTELVSVLRNIRPSGGTNTPLAMQVAYSYWNAQNIILFTDGRPQVRFQSTEALVEQTLQFVAQRKHREIVINTVGLGDYFNTDKGTDSETFRLLVGLAEETGGSFRGR